jgi:hypothetical protein
MRSHNANEFTGRDDLALLPELRKMSAISCDQVVSNGFVAAFQKYIVIRVAAYVQTARRGDDMAAILDELEQLQTEPLADTQLRA